MVEWKKLGDLGKFENIGTDKKINEGEKLVTLLNYVDIYHNKYIDGSIPHMQVSASDKKIKDCTVEQGDIFVTPSSETVDDIGHSSVITETVPNAVYSYHIMRYRLFEKNMLLSYYINYAFDTEIVKKQILKKAQGLTRFGLSKDKFASIQIPIPSLSEQERIVGILDTFTSSIENLKAQISLRRKQYEHYRDKLLDLEGKPGVKMKTLGEIALFSQGIQVPLPEQSLEKLEGYSRFLRIIDYTQGNEEPRYVHITDKRYWVSKDDIAMVRYGTPGYVCRGFEGILANNLFKISLKEMVKMDVSYLACYLKSNIFQSIINQKCNGGALQAISFGLIKDIPIPLPSLQEQSRIVSILDEFEASIKNLEAQLQAREKQYEYYRNKLLTFE